MTTKSSYQVSDQFLGKPRPIHVVVIGAGIAGIAAVKIFHDTFKDLPAILTIYEKNGDVGGTWLENRYPGCACDVPAHGYTYSWEGNPYWSKPYVGAPEIFEYYKGRATAYGVYKHVKFHHRLIDATWEGSTGQWKLQIENLQSSVIVQDGCNILINAAGFLNNWRWPDIKGIQDYKGTLAHSASWDDDYKFKGKTVGIIGSGSSAIQILPIIQKEAEKIVSFNRSVTWITPEFAEQFSRDEVFSDEQKLGWAKDPESFLKYRKAVATNANKVYNVYAKGSAEQNEIFEKSKSGMEKRLGFNKSLMDALIPQFEVGCRRLTPGHGYLEALTLDNVVVRRDSIANMTEEGIRMVDGTEFSLDAIICATGFDTSFRPSFNVINADGIDLRDFWKKEPRSYLSVAVAGFPNYFMATGPNFPLANGDVVASIEQTIKYAFKAAIKIQTQGILGLSPTPKAVDEFQEHKDAVMADLVWTSSCVSWYKNGKRDGKVWGPYSGSVPHFLELLSEPRWEDYDITYQTSNRFQYLGNGRSVRDNSDDGLAWYIR